LYNEPVFGVAVSVRGATKKSSDGIKANIFGSWHIRDSGDTLQQ